MGIERYAAEFLLHCRRLGVDFRRTLTLGRQDMAVIADDLVAMGVEQPEAVELARARTAEPLLRYAGAEVVESLDASANEGATIVHDLNQPLPPALDRAFTAVIDGGTLEHVFDFPRALRNALGAVEVGGWFLTTTPTNNEAGHGLYQFSPELWFRALSPENGFEVETALLREMSPRRQWWEVRDPAVVGSRAHFRSRYPTMLFVAARRTGNAQPLRVTPMQSDYVAYWTTGVHRISDPRRVVRAGLRHLRPAARRRPDWYHRYRYQSLRKHFRSMGKRL
jgi:hypothetical protein